MRKDSRLQKDFFNAIAKNWRVGYPIKTAVFDDLFSGIPLTGKRVLDVACGTGVLTEYLAKKALFVDAIDVSDEMIARAKTEVSAPNISFSVADFYEFDGRYDNIFVFDAYPHFLDKEGFFKKSAELLNDGGILTVAFDESRAHIDAHHKTMDPALSAPIGSVEEEAVYFDRYFLPLSTRDDDKYALILKKK